MYKKLIVFILFSIAMAMLESAVVIYLRLLLFNGSFSLVLGKMNELVIITELVREFATIIMLFGIAYIMGNTKWNRFAYFILAFAIWDIFYYVFLYIFLHWPNSILDWDVLFLIPVPWYGPVLTPILISCWMITWAALILYFENRKVKISIKFIEQILVYLGCAIILYSYTKEYFEKVIFSNTSSESFVQKASSFAPTLYSWPLFIIGFSIILIGTFLFYKSNQKLNNN